MLLRLVRQHLVLQQQLRDLPAQVETLIRRVRAALRMMKPRSVNGPWHACSCPCWPRCRRTSSASGNRSWLAKITMHTGSSSHCSPSPSRRSTTYTGSSGPRAGRYAPAIARSFPAVSRGSPPSSRNPIAAARRGIGAFLRGSVARPESSQPRCRQERTSSPQEYALAVRSHTGCRPVRQGAASRSSYSRQSPLTSVPPPRSRALTPAAPTHTECSQDCFSPW